MLYIFFTMRPRPVTSQLEPETHNRFLVRFTMLLYYGLRTPAPAMLRVKRNYYII